MSAILLDTTVLIDALRGRPAAERLRCLRDRGDVPHICAINAAEVFRGLRPEEEPPARRLMAALAVAPLSAAEGMRAGVWRRQFAEQGRMLSQADCLIAAAASGIGAALATGNPDDFPMAELAVHHWPVGE